jgi:hypothetical protein
LPCGARLLSIVLAQGGLSLFSLTLCNYVYRPAGLTQEAGITRIAHSKFDAWVTRVWGRTKSIQ